MSGPAVIPQLTAEQTAGLLTPAAAADALAAALRGGLDPEGCPQRTALPVPGGGELLLMPAASGTYAGVKIAGVAPGNPARGLPRITGSYLLLDGPTLRPLALLDGAALTALRTPAVSALALRHLAPAGRPLRLVLFGSGPQAYGHLEATLAVRELAEVVVVARRPEGAEKLAAHARSLGPAARTGTPEDVAGADLVVCCTTAREPLFDGRLVGPGATVVAVGSHEPEARETDTALVRRAAVYVESRAAALREAGDLLVPEAEGAIGPGHITGTLADLVTGRMPVGGTPGCPQLFKSVGMAWEDLAVAVALFQAAGASSET
ncbi:ornithine cyclodeaminase family protein [Streptomyces sp. ISL-44]|uniref:ornithine cyclodeaminase family protein n=1 Tax=unclassified Streptomyces TaxID=2593676 RepID=UPI001BE622E1|nr:MULTISPECIES: ornithine cyclodeaminase family protein [unclassified Streptomyces]MBT2541395.1 ornithine cyclodeaminase family protein [Streptomyces sp. ISL-44]UUU39448.1 ornithine cyclodeaminase family protein [Streptomyces sp. NBC_00162]